ncbi:MAG: hypothetical protein MJE77_15970 [Proteobacteria bacterium]|nr:hypothetical protein [Pseudomonadota bacterium]
MAAVLSATGGTVVRAAESLHAHPRLAYRWSKRLSVSLDSSAPAPGLPDGCLGHCLGQSPNRLYIV